MPELLQSKNLVYFGLVFFCHTYQMAIRFFFQKQLFEKKLAAEKKMIALSAPPTSITPVAPLSDQPILNVDRVLGEGAFGFVIQGVWDDKPVAVKLIDASDDMRLLCIHREVMALRLVSHPNVCIFKGWYMPTTTICAIVTELCDGGDLFTRVSNGPLPENRIQSWMCGIVCAVAHMHGMGIVHCDIKLENMMISQDGRCKLIDFGLVNQHRAGSGSYCAPEVLYTDNVHPGRDVWSLGVCFFACATGYFPFHNATKADWRFKKICERQESGILSTCAGIHEFYKRQCTMSSPLVALIDSALRISVKLRASAPSLLLSTWMAYCPPH